jgi:hypothetical protein
VTLRRFVVQVMATAVNTSPAVAASAPGQLPILFFLA